MRPASHFICDSHYRPILRVKQQMTCMKAAIITCTHAQFSSGLMRFRSGVVEFVRFDILCFQGVLGLQVALKCHSLCGSISVVLSEGHRDLESDSQTTLTNRNKTIAESCFIVNKA